MTYTITKYQHACLIVSKNNQRLIIDPGSFTSLPNDLSNVVAVVVTEEHMDHFNLDNLKAIVGANPDAVIYTTQKVADNLAEQGITAQTGMTSADAGEFALTFFETDHAPIYQASPCRSMPVMVDSALYYPSDSYHVIDEQYEVLALPVSGPWHKISEAVDFAKQCNFKQIITTHDAILSEIGYTVTNNFIKGNLPEGTNYQTLAAGETMTVEV